MTTSKGEWQDPETGLVGRDFWDSVVRVESARSARYGRSVTIVLLELVRGPDIDLQVVLRIAAVLRTATRASDYLARIGPMTFAVLMPETDEISAINLVERLRAACDDSLRALGSPARPAFGWAQASTSTRLEVAIEIAGSRLAHEMAALGIGT